MKRARQRWWLYNIMNILNATEGHTLEKLILCCVNFTSIKKKKKRKEEKKEKG